MKPFSGGKIRSFVDDKFNELFVDGNKTFEIEGINKQAKPSIDKSNSTNAGGCTSE